MHRHWIDPTLPFTAAVGSHAHGLLVTSATLRDATGDPEADWLAAEARTGAVHLSGAAVRAAVPSPFRSEERRVGKGCVSTFRSRLSPVLEKKKTSKIQHQ